MTLMKKDDLRFDFMRLFNPIFLIYSFVPESNRKNTFLPLCLWHLLMCCNDCLSIPTARLPNKNHNKCSCMKAPDLYQGHARFFPIRLRRRKDKNCRNAYFCDYCCLTSLTVFLLSIPKKISPLHKYVTSYLLHKHLYRALLLSVPPPERLGADARYFL